MSLGLVCLSLKNEPAELEKSEVSSGSENFQFQDAMAYKGLSRNLGLFVYV